MFDTPIANMHQARLMLEIAYAQAEEKAKAIIAAALKVRWSSKLILASVKRHLARWAHLAVPVDRPVWLTSIPQLIRDAGDWAVQKYRRFDDRYIHKAVYKFTPTPTNNGLQIPAMVTNHD